MMLMSESKNIGRTNKNKQHVARGQRVFSEKS